MEKDIKSIVYSTAIVEFVTVAVQYSILIESGRNLTQEELTDKLSKLLPFLYLKTLLVPEMATIEEEEMPETSVTEENYNYILSELSTIYAGDDTYLEVFVEDMKYSDTPITEKISENLTDIYQDLKNCVTIYERGVTENMNDAVYICLENFKTYWGQKLVNVLRALHTLKFSAHGDNTGNGQLGEIDLW